MFRSRHRPLICLLLLAFLPQAWGQRAAPLPALTGTSLTLSTSTNRIVPTPLRTQSQPVLAALVTLRNNARQAATFSFSDPELARSKFTFSLFNADNTLVWTGTGSPTKRTPELTSGNLTLPPKSSWQVAARIPLTTQDTWLPPGFYRLEATLNGSPVTFAATSFEIAAMPQPPTPRASGILGLILSPAIPSTPAAGASVTIEPINTLSHGATAESYAFQGTVGPDGRFDAKLEPGTYLVRVSWSRPQSAETQNQNQTTLNPVPPLTASKTVVVPKGRMAPLTIRLSAPLLPVRPVQPDSPSVLSVEEVSAMVILSEDGSRKIRVRAEGTVPHPGYTNARLVPPLVVPAIAPADGGRILFLQLVTDAPAPNLFYPQVITAVSAEITLPYNEETQVWVFSQSNTLTRSVGNTTPTGPNAP
jgi:hypothetical protein